MRIIIDTECEDVIEQAKVWAKYGRAHVEFDMNRICIRSDEEIKDAIMRVLQFFSVKSQWVAVYRVLVDYYDFPKEKMSFCKRVRKMMRGACSKFPCDYQSIQKALASNSILCKPYSDWVVYSVKAGERFFPRQKMIADKLLEQLEKPKFTMDSL